MCLRYFLSFLVLGLRIVALSHALVSVTLSMGHSCGYGLEDMRFFGCSEIEMQYYKLYHRNV